MFITSLNKIIFQFHCVIYKLLYFIRGSLMVYSNYYSVEYLSELIMPQIKFLFILFDSKVKRCVVLGVHYTLYSVDCTLYSV